MGGSESSERVSCTPPRGCGNSDSGYATSTISYDAYSDNKLKVTPNVTATPYYSSGGNGVDVRYGASISYNFMGGK